MTKLSVDEQRIRDRAILREMQECVQAALVNGHAFLDAAGKEHPIQIISPRYRSEQTKWGHCKQCNQPVPLDPRAKTPRVFCDRNCQSKFWHTAHRSEVRRRRIARKAAERDR
jgi:hypothetical protein